MKQKKDSGLVGILKTTLYYFMTGLETPIMMLLWILKWIGILFFFGGFIIGFGTATYDPSVMPMIIFGLIFFIGAQFIRDKYTDITKMLQPKN